LENGADVNVKTDEGWAPLHSAIANKHSDIAAYLIENGASLNQKGTENDKTPLHLTAEFDLFNIAELLIENGADIEIREGSVGAPPLFEAAQWGRLDIVKLLVEHGANPNNGTNTGFKPVQIAKHNKHYDIVRYIESLSEDRSKIQERNIASTKVQNKVIVDPSVSHSNKNVDEKNYAQWQEEMPESNNKKLGQLILKMLPQTYLNNWEVKTGQPSDYNESLEEFCKLLREGADPQAIRIDGFKSSSETVNLNSNVQLTRFSSGSQGKIVAADKEGLTLLEFCKKNDLKEVYEILEHHLADTNNRIEELTWQKKQAEDPISGYEEYLNKYPEGKFAPEANQKLHDLYWERTFTNVNRESFELYLKKYPEGKYSKNAEYRIERFIWAEAEDKKMDIDLYCKYLDKYPAGQYADMAKSHIEDLFWAESQKIDTLERYKEYLSNYPDGKYVAEATDKIGNTDESNKDNTKENKKARYIESDKYSFKVAIPDGWEDKFPKKELSALQRVIDGYMDENGNSVYVSETTKNPYEQMSEDEFFNLNLNSLKRVMNIDASGPIKIGKKTANYLMGTNTALNPNIYQGVCILRMNNCAITIYVTHDNKNSFMPIWDYVVNNSIF